MDVCVVNVLIIPSYVVNANSHVDTINVCSSVMLPNYLENTTKRGSIDPIGGSKKIPDFFILTYNFF